jgi:hypothetical protein
LKGENLAVLAMVGIVGLVALIGIIFMMRPVGSSYAYNPTVTGEAVKGGCTDSDNGITYDVKGTATKGGTKKVDYCINTASLMEYYCSGNSILQTSYSCPFGCLNGACKSQPDSCSDTDGGNKIGIFGTVTGYISGQSYTYSDSCFDAGSVKEYYCSGTASQSLIVSCGTDYYSANYCQGASVYKNFIDYSCASGVCSSVTISQIVQNCPYGCTSGVCDSCTPVCAGKSCGPNGCGGSCGICGSGYFCDGTGHCAALPYQNETDSCLFMNSFNATHFCYSNKGNCTGRGMCNVFVAGANGEQVQWASDCIGSPSSIIDGVNENLYFNCTY